MNKRKLLIRVRNNPKNVRFSDFLSLAEAFGFVMDRVSGGHHILHHPSFGELLNLQPDDRGRAKAYQVRQFLDLVDAHGLRLED